MPLIWLELIGVLNSKENKTFNAENLFLSFPSLPSFLPKNISKRSQYMQLIYFEVLSVFFTFLLNSRDSVAALAPDVWDKL